MQDQPQARLSKESSSARGVGPEAAAGDSPASSPAPGMDLGPLLERDATPTTRGQSPAGGSAQDRGAEVVGSGTGSGGPRSGLGPGSGLPQPGDRLDVFEVEEAIGVGGMGAVFRARDTRLDREVALKVLPPEVAGDAENIRRFYQEARAAARLDHENIARVYSIGQERGVHFIAFEYIDGTNIRQRVDRQGPLSVAEAINYTLQIAGALVHASERGVVHRDIKPSNLIVTSHGRAKLVDMGLARRFERTGTDDGLTQSGMTLGTFDYISPEQARDPRDVDVRSDLYSLGCTMYHMLTGHPPFPGGTVLQKLLSHREEPAPDVRSLNPSVPPELAAIILKLMAKERDRRYQTPDQLMRELQSLAGSLGMRSISPEGLVWTDPQAPPAWERHLFWGLPAGLLVTIVGALLWWGQPETNRDAEIGALGLDLPAATATATEAARRPPPVPVEDEASRTATVEPPSDRVPAARTGDESAGATAAERSVEAATTEELAAAIRAIDGPTSIVLTTAGPYELPDGPTIRHRLSIRAASGVRPELRGAPTTVSGREARPMIGLEGTTATFEGLTFTLGAGASGPAVRAENSRLTLRDCVLRGEGRPSTLEIVSGSSTPGSGSRPAEAVYLEGCHFESARVAILGHGPVDLGLRDCTFASSSPVIWLDNAGGASPVPSRLWLDHVSLLAGVDPVLRFDGTAARVQMLDSLVAPSLEGEPATLVAIDDPSRLDWSGRGNLYARVGTFLLPTQEGGARRPVWGYADWAETKEGPRETGSRLVQEHVWQAPDPSLALARGNDPASAFRLGTAVPGLTGAGARRSVATQIIPPVSAVASRRAGEPADASSTSNPASAAVAVASNAAAPAVSPIDNSPMPGPMTMPGDSTPPQPMIMPTEDPDPSGVASLASRNGGTGAASSPAAGGSTPDSRSAGGGGITSPAVPPSGVDASPRLATNAAPTPDERTSPAQDNLVRTALQFLERLRVVGPQGGVIRLAADADLELPTCVVQGGGLLEVVASPGASRPRLRFRPSTEEEVGSPGWPVLFLIRSGGLKLQGIDLLLTEARAPVSGRWAAFGLGAGTSLEVEASTLTLQGTKRSAIVRVQGSEAEDGEGVAEAGSASVRFLHSLLRCGDDVVEVSAGRRVELSMTNVVAMGGGSLLRGHALPPGLEEVRLKADLRQVTALMAGGVLRLESALGEPDLPVAEVSVRDSIVGTGGVGTALIRVDGQDEVDDLADRVRWEGHRVAYHRLDSYRRDQSAQPGTLPLILDRGQWELYLGGKEESPFHGDVRFEREPALGRAPWALGRRDVRLDPESPALSSGPDLSRIPEPGDTPVPAGSRSASGAEDLRELLPSLRFD